MFAITSLHSHLVTRSYDMHLDLDLNTLSIQDSQRCEAQRDVARTPATDRMLVHVSYVAMSSTKSPFFRGHGREVSIDFAELVLNVDVKALQRLRPFYEVLLGRRDVPRDNGGDGVVMPPAAIRLSNALVYATEMLAGNNRIAAGYAVQDKEHPWDTCNTSVPGPNATSSQRPVDRYAAPKTLHAVCTLGKISLDMLRPASAVDMTGKPGTATNPNNTGVNSALPSPPAPSGDVALDPMFCLEISDLRADVVMEVLTNARVWLRSVHVLDRRDISRDYAFKTMIAPDTAGLYPSSVARPSAADLKEPVPENVERLEQKQEDPPSDFLHIIYNQQSSDAAFVDIVFSDMTSFLSLDAVLDLIHVSVSNSFAVLDLIAPVNNSITLVSQSAIDDPRLLKPYSPYTMIVRVRIPNSRLIFLEDPTTLESRAIVGRCGIESTYVREVKAGVTREIHDGWHVSAYQMEVFVLANIQRWSPLQILEPLGLEFHMARVIEQGIVVSVSLSLDTDVVDARVSLNDIALAHSILLRRTLIETRPPPVDEDGIGVSAIEEEEIIASLMSGGLQVTVYELAVNMGSLSLIIINDFNGQNSPLLRLQVEGRWGRGMQLFIFN